MKKPPLYHYRANIVSVYDGDTCTAEIDLGLSTWVKGEKIRLLRINAPEIRGKERKKGLKSRDGLRKLILGKSVIIKSFKDKRGKYGRYLGEIYLEDENGKWINVNDELVRMGLAEYKDY